MYFVSQYGVYQQVHLNQSLLIHLPQLVEIRKLKLRPETCARSNFQCRTGGNLTTKLRTETCVAQKPKHNKGRGLSLDKLNTIIFLIISTVSSQVSESVLMKLGVIASRYCQ